MMNNVPKPDISPDFTIEDIRKIREWHDECRKGMSREEVITHINRRGNEFEVLVEAARRSSHGAPPAPV
ncbi:MAG: hypothetical protein LBH95_06295 [Oscillospiraceae bacterium]|jgi:hypothetical protein|nr:hypothetical protein [Oscillospiraceae bacterium]